MEIIQVLLIGIISTILAITIKKTTPDIGMIVSIAACILIFLMIMPWLNSIIEIIKYIEKQISINSDYIGIVIKIIGIAYISEFGFQICSDAGENAIGHKIDLAGRILIMVVSMPIFISLVNMIFSIL